MANPSRVAQKTIKLLNELVAKVDVLLEHSDIPAKALKELDEKLGKVHVYRSPKPVKQGAGLSHEEVAARTAESPKGKKAEGGAKKEKPAQKGNPKSEAEAESED